MKNQIKQLFGLFSEEEDISIICTESWDSVNLSASVILGDIPEPETFLKNIPIISSRDSWVFKVLDENGDPILSIT